jgi:hypothetical protein
MPSQHQTDDHILTQYLLGELAEEETERLDEMSIVDDEVAWRLRSVENDLVDAYVRGKLSGETLERFKSSYLSTPQRRKRVILANALLSIERQSTPAAPPLRWWAIAAAALLIVASLAFVFTSRRRSIPPHSNVAQTVVTKPAIRNVAPIAPAASFVLLPPTRAVSAIQSLDIPTNAQRVDLEMRLESNDYPSYQASLRDLVANEIIWKSAPLTASAGSHPGVSIQLPRSILRQQNYSVELAGLPPGQSAELIGSYAFRVAVN